MSTPVRSWLLAVRDYGEHHTGDPTPRTRRKYYLTETKAREALARLAATPGHDFVGFVSPIHERPPRLQQADMGFPHMQGFWLTE